MNSAIYECRVMHQRLRPKRHGFSYGVFYLWLDLDELDELAKKSWLLKKNRWGLFSFFDADHIMRGAADARANVLLTLAEEGVDTGRIHSVRLLTFPRVLGYIFNPVCFYYAFDSAGQPLAAVAEVTNTFHEQKPYVLTDFDATSERFRTVVPKHFYVSPFLDLELKFDFKLRLPSEQLEIHVDDWDGPERAILTRLTGQRRELTDAGLLRCFFKYPLVTLRVIFLIHYHAFRLWMKGLHVYRKKDQPDLQRGVYRPHHTLSQSKTTP
jgi:uncharacterized protein